jgi:Ca2+/Na+ antiporter
MTVVYGYILMQGASLIGSGSELLLLVPRLAPLVGSVVLPVLGAVPDGMMVLVSGIGPDAQNEVAVGVGALAGSTIMLLTLPWFLAVLAGRVSVNKNGSLNYKKSGEDGEGWQKLRPEHKCSLLRSAVAIREEIKTGAKWMLGTLTAYVIIQGSAFTVDQPGGSSGPVKKGEDDVHKEAILENKFALAGLVVCVLEFVYYLYVQAKDAGTDSNVENKIIDAQVNALKNKKTTLRGVMGDLREQKWTTTLRTTTNTDLEQALLNKDTKEEVQRMCKILHPFFVIYDVDKNKTIDRVEFSAILKDVNEDVSKEYQRRLFDAADADQSGSISFEEFVACVIAIAIDEPTDLNEPRKTVPREPTKFIMEDGSPAGEAEEEDDDEEEDVIPDDLAGLSPAEQQTRIKRRSLYQMGLGTLIILVFSDPMVDLLGEIGTKVGVPAFYVSFVLAPLASNSAELLAAYNYAQKRTVKSIGTSLVQLEGAAIMNNTFCLGIFLALVYFKRLAWEFSAETIAIVSIQVVIGILVLMRSEQKLLEALVVISLYPLSLGLVWALENKLGWD